MKFGICIPTYGNSAFRLERCLQSVKQFSEGIDYEIFVQDDGTADLECVAVQEYVSKQAGASYYHEPTWKCGARTLQALGIRASHCDILVFLSDDCLVSQNWLYPIQHYYEWNAEVRIGMVSTPFIEAWEMTVAGVIPNDRSFYDWKNDGTLLREDLVLDEEKFEALKREGRISIDHFTPLGPLTDKKFRLLHPVPIDGGLGPCFTIRAELFRRVGGFDYCDFLGDYEALLGWKCWKAGYHCVMIPGPPIYHARGLASQELTARIPKEELDKIRPWTDQAKAKLVEDWGYDFVGLEKRFTPLLQRSSYNLARTRCIKYQQNQFPINVAYDKLTDVNLGPIHWQDARQQQRMAWIGLQCSREEGNSILDIGCANGGLNEFFNAVDLSYTGVDLDRVRIDQAKIKYPLEKFFVLDATYGLPFSYKQFSIVVCADCLEHIPFEKAQELVKNDICRVAAKRVLITLPISEATVPNIDHVWAPHPDRIQDFLEPVLEEWELRTIFIEDFALIQLERKCVVSSEA